MPFKKYNVTSLRSDTLDLYYKLKAMKSILNRINVESIEFETGTNEAFVTCNITQGNDTYRTELIVDHTDINRLIGRLQQLASNTDVMSCFENIDLGDGNLLYSMECNKAGIGDLWIEHVEFGSPLRQIRA